MLYFLFCIVWVCHGACAKFPDWLISDIKLPTTLTKTNEGNLILTNGLISRVFSINPDFTTVDYYSHKEQSSILRALNPEAVIGLDGVVYNVGYVKTNITRAYLNRTALKDDFKYAENSYHFVGYDTENPKAPFPYKPMRGAPQDITWPPKGLRLNVHFKAPDSAPYDHRNIQVCIHYEMYDGLPAMSKWISLSVIRDESLGKVAASVYSVEILSVNQQWSQRSPWDGPYNTYQWLFIETDQAHGSQANWKAEPNVKIAGAFIPWVNVTYDVHRGYVPSVRLQSNGLETFHVHELAHGASDETRRALGRHRLMRLLAPHIQENPIYFHLTRSDTVSFRKAVEQLAEVGFEMVIYSFGSGFNMESDNDTYIAGIKEDIEFANNHGIEVGGYDLIVLDRNLEYKYMAISSDNKTLGSACMASKWYDVISGKILSFIDRTGLSMVETDGPYGGGTCASEQHPYHENLKDSLYKQEMLQGKLFLELRKRNIFINQPDRYFYQGGNKDGLGYNENQYSLPRWMDLSISRQTVFDRIYNFPPTAGWMFLPLTIYHGGGDAAQFEPLSKHLTEYSFGLAQYLGAGVAACYRGYRIFDTEETKEMVKNWVTFYKKYRDILTSDIVRVRRPDMQSIDSYMHVNYKLENKGLAMVFNPTLKHIQMNLTLPLYYTGIKKIVSISEQEYGSKEYPLDMGWEVEVFVDIQPQSVTWLLVKDGGA